MAKDEKIGRLILDVEVNDKKLKPGLAAAKTQVTQDAASMATSMQKLTNASDQAGKSQELLGAAAAATGQSWLGQASAVSGLAKSLIAMPAVFNPITIAAGAAAVAVALIWNRKKISDWLAGVKEAEEALDKLQEKATAQRQSQSDQLRQLRVALEQATGTRGAEGGNRAITEMRELLQAVQRVTGMQAGIQSQRNAVMQQSLAATARGLSPEDALAQSRGVARIDISDRIHKARTQLEGMRKVLADVAASGYDTTKIERAIRKQEALVLELTQFRVRQEKDYTRQFEALAKTREAAAAAEEEKKKQWAELDLQRRLRMGQATRAEVREHLLGLAAQMQGQTIFRQQLQMEIASLPEELQDAARRAVNIMGGPTGTTGTSGHVPVTSYPGQAAASVSFLARSGLGEKLARVRSVSSDIYDRYGLRSQVGPLAGSQAASVFASDTAEKDTLSELKTQTDILRRIERERKGLK